MNETRKNFSYFATSGEIITTSSDTQVGGVDVTKGENFIDFSLELIFKYDLKTHKVQWAAVTTIEGPRSHPPHLKALALAINKATWNRRPLISCWWPPTIRCPIKGFSTSETWEGKPKAPRRRINTEALNKIALIFTGYGSERSDWISNGDLLCNLYKFLCFVLQWIVEGSLLSNNYKGHLHFSIIKFKESLYRWVRQTANKS